MAATIEERVSALEAKLSRLLDEKNDIDEARNDLPWWEQRFGAFADSPEYAQAVAAGRAYREAQRPEDEAGGG